MQQTPGINFMHQEAFESFLSLGGVDNSGQGPPMCITHAILMLSMLRERWSNSGISEQSVTVIREFGLARTHSYIEINHQKTHYNMLVLWTIKCFKMKNVMAQCFSGFVFRTCDVYWFIHYIQKFRALWLSDKICVFIVTFSKLLNAMRPRQHFTIDHQFALKRNWPLSL